MTADWPSSRRLPRLPDGEYRFAVLGGIGQGQRPLPGIDADDKFTGFIPAAPGGHASRAHQRLQFAGGKGTVPVPEGGHLPDALPQAGVLPAPGVGAPVKGIGVAN